MQDPNLLTETEPVEPEPVTEPAEPKAQPTPQVDYEKKFSESTRENQLLQERLKAIEKAEQESTKEPTDSELRAAFPEWDGLSDFDKGLAKRTLNAERLAGASAKTTGDLAAERSWNTSIELALSSNNTLEGKEQAFRQFASRPQYRGVPMELIVDAFLGKNASQPPSPKPTPKPGLETGTGGPKTPEKPKTLSAEDLKNLRTTDEKAYMEYIRTRDINPDDL